jgi:hypothetical protein
MKTSAFICSRSGKFARNGDTVATAAPLDIVTSVYGSSGLFGEGGVTAAFGGAAFYRNDKAVPPMWVYGVPEKRRDFEKRFGAQAFASRSSAVTRLLA